MHRKVGGPLHFKVVKLWEAVSFYIYFEGQAHQLVYGCDVPEMREKGALL